MSSGLITADAADKWLERRVNLPTHRDSAGIADIPQNVRAHAFFSAKVAEARILERLRGVSDAYSRGEINKAEAVGKLKSYLVSEGYMAGDRRNPPPPGVDPDAWKAAGRLTNLASTSRLDLILEQNAAMAHGVRLYDEGMSERALRRRPYWQYVHGMTGTPKSPRAEHQQYDGLVFAKTDPIWRSLFPPNGFRCHCGVREVSADEAQKIGLAAADKVEIPAGQVFTFDPAEAFTASNISGLQPLDRQRILAQAEEAVLNQDIGKCGVTVAPPTVGLPPQPLAGEKEVKSAFEAMEAAAREELKSVGLDPDNLPDYQTVNDAFKANKKNPDFIPAEILDHFPSTAIELTRLDQRFAEALDMPRQPIIISRGTTYIGVIHQWRNHKDMFINSRKMMDALRATVGNPNCRCVASFERIKKRINVHGKRETVTKTVRRIVLHNPGMQYYCVLSEVDGVLQLTSLHEAPDEYGTRQWSLQK